jgi:cytochrome c biogenesis protein
VLQNYPEFDTDNRGDWLGLRFDGLQPFFVTGLQVAKDLGYPWWLAGCCVLFLGLGIAFYTSHRRLWAKVSADGSLSLAGAAHKNQAAFETFYDELAGALRAGAGGAQAPA